MENTLYQKKKCFFPSKIRNSKALDENIEINAAIPNSSSLKI